MLNRDGQDVTLHIEVEQDVFVEIPRFRDTAALQFDEKCVGVFEMANSYGVSLRSKTIELTNP